MAEPTKISPKVPGVLRGTATVECTKTSHLRGEGTTHYTSTETGRFDANYWVDFAAKVEDFRKTIQGRGCSAKVIDISLDDNYKPSTPKKSEPKADAQGASDTYKRLREQCIKAGRRDCDMKGR